MSDNDLERLEASLRWLQRESTAGRVPPATPARPDVRPELRAEALNAGRGNAAGRRSPASLEPERLVPPPIRPRENTLRGPTSILVTALVVVPIAYYFTLGGSTSTPMPPRGPKLTSVEPQTSVAKPAAPAQPATREEPRQQQAEVTAEPPAPPPAAVVPEPAQSAPPAPQRGDRVALSRPNPASGVSEPPTQPNAAAEVSPPRVSTPAPAIAAVEPMPPRQPIREMSAADVQLLLKQGEQFVAAGDLVSARLVLRRAAEAGNAAAAMALGASYDPILLARLGVMGVEADVEKARTWYQVAKNLGSPEAPRRLEMLANRQ